MRRAFNIAIYGGEKRQISLLRRALKCLRQFDFSAFRKVTRRLRAIVIVPRTGYANETFVHQRLWVTQSSVFSGGYRLPQYFASLLIHEAHHIAQFETGRPYRGAAAEERAYRVQRAFLKRVGYDTAVRWLDKQYRSRWWDAMDRNNFSHNEFERDLQKLRPLF